MAAAPKTQTISVLGTPLLRVRISLRLYNFFGWMPTFHCQLQKLKCLGTLNFHNSFQRRLQVVFTGEKSSAFGDQCPLGRRTGCLHDVILKDDSAANPPFFSDLRPGVQ
jgi:hypothetical protein